MLYFTTLLLKSDPNIEYERILDKNPISSLNIPYTIEYMEYLISYYEGIEEYEKCKIILDFKSFRTNHDFVSI